MNKFLILSVIIVALLVISVAAPLAIAGKGGTKGPNQCKDGIDNDNDGLIDYPADPGVTLRMIITSLMKYHIRAAIQTMG